MAEARITPARLDALKLIKSGAVEQRNCGYGSWRIFGGQPTVVGHLVSMGLAEWGAMVGDRRACSLTDAGAAALASHEGER